MYFNLLFFSPAALWLSYNLSTIPLSHTYCLSGSMGNWWPQVLSCHGPELREPMVLLAAGGRLVTRGHD